MQPALATIIRTAILCQERLPIGDLELSVGDPDRHALPRQARLGIDVEALDTDKAIEVHGPQKLHLAKQVQQPPRGRRYAPVPIPTLLQGSAGHQGAPDAPSAAWY
jgi:hypothetical protein